MAECTELSIPLLKNKSSLCWFDAGNFALFHKRRPELDRFFAKPENKKEGWDIVEEVYDHFSGKKIAVSIRALMQKFRTNKDLQTFFNSFTKQSSIFLIKKKISKRSTARIETGKNIPEMEDSVQKDFEFNPSDQQYEIYGKINDRYFIKIDGKYNYTIPITEAQLNEYFQKKEFSSKEGFRIDSDEINDTSDYISGFLKKGIFDTTDKNETTSFLSEIRVSHVDFQLSEKTLTENSSTVFIETGYILGHTKEQNYPEVLSLPVQKGDSVSMTDFRLDAIVMHTGGAHYYTLVRCVDSNEWVKYDDTEFQDGQTIGQRIQIKKQGKEKIFADFPVVSKYNTSAKILIYSI